MSPRVPLSSATTWPPDWLSSYRPADGYDELVNACGGVRPLWQTVMQNGLPLHVADLARRGMRAEASLAQSGIVHRVYGAGEGLRPWPFSPLPILLGGEEWAYIAAGVIERAELLNALLADAYGAATWVRDGLVPAGLYAGSPDYARPMVRRDAPDPQPLRFYAVDLARGSDGEWHVLTDRTQAPSGAGYARANRRAMAHACPFLERGANVESLDGFFAAFRDHLQSLSHHDDACCALWSPGPLNETYFEHADLARDLGLILVEGQDLLVQHGEVFVRAATGLKRCDVLWRRVDSDFTDPLEFNMRSRLGVPGLAHAVRCGNVKLVNIIGSGLTESRAMMAVLPWLAERINGVPLKLRTLKTLWAIDDAARQTVIERCDDLVIGSAFGASLPGVGYGSRPGSSLTPEDRQLLLSHMIHRGVDVVAHEPLRLATTPILVEGCVVPRPFIMRIFAAWTGDHWHVMPGGFARVSARDDEGGISLQQGGRSADVWIVNDAPAARYEISREALPRYDERAAFIPRRTADNLLWLGRYSARAALVTSIVQAVLKRAAGRDAGLDQALCATLTAWGALSSFDPNEPPRTDAVLHDAIFGEAQPQSVRCLWQHARAASMTLYDRLPSDCWPLISEISALLEIPRDDRSPLTNIERVSDIAERLRRWSAWPLDSREGSIAWVYFDLGQRIERGIGIARLIERFGTDDRLLDLAGMAPSDDGLAFEITRIGEHVARIGAFDALNVMTDLQERAASAPTSSDPWHLQQIVACLMDLSVSIFSQSVTPMNGRGKGA